MSDYKNVLKKCADMGIDLWTENGKLKYKASTNTLSQDILRELKKYKEQIIEYLEKENQDLIIVHDDVKRYEAFPLTEVQSAYLLGREDYYDYGNTACHVYQEFVYERLDVAKVEMAWNKLIQKHDALRTVIYKAGYQKVLETTPYFEVHEYKNMEDGSKELERIRDDFGRKVFPLEKWPMFEIAVSQFEDKSRLHFSMDFWLRIGQVYGCFWKNLRTYISIISWNHLLILHLEIMYYLKNVKSNVKSMRRTEHFGKKNCHIFVWHHHYLI